MAKIKINKYATDSSKANSGLDFEFHPFEEYPDVVVRGRHLQPAENVGFISVNEDGRMFPNFRNIFMSKVTSIENLELEYKEGVAKEYKTASEVLSDKNNVVLDKLVKSTANYILHNGNLTDDETKN